MTPGPAKAYDLLEHLGDDGAAKPPSVYRSLDFLLEMGLVAGGRLADLRRAGPFLVAFGLGLSRLVMLRYGIDDLDRAIADSAAESHTSRSRTFRSTASSGVLRARLGFAEPVAKDPEPGAVAGGLQVDAVNADVDAKAAPFTRRGVPIVLVVDEVHAFRVANDSRRAGGDVRNKRPVVGRKPAAAVVEKHEIILRSVHLPEFNFHGKMQLLDKKMRTFWQSSVCYK